MTQNKVRGNGLENEAKRQTTWLNRRIERGNLPFHFVGTHGEELLYLHIPCPPPPWLHKQFLGESEVISRVFILSRSQYVAMVICFVRKNMYK